MKSFACCDNYQRSVVIQEMSHKLMEYAFPATLTWLRITLPGTHVFSQTQFAQPDTQSQFDIEIL